MSDKHFSQDKNSMNGEEQQPDGCACLTSPTPPLMNYRQFGMDSQYGEVTLLLCPACGQIWLRYLYEMEGFSRSGRWYRGAITGKQAAEVTAGNARAMLEGLEWYFYGGSYFEGRSGRSSGPLSL
jgi:hypothetical protein